MPKVVAWDEETWEKELMARLTRAMQYRSNFEDQWNDNYNVVNNMQARQNDGVNITADNSLVLEAGEVDQGDSDIGINLIFKYTRFWHSQMSANPPSVIARPRSPDPRDRRKADAADRIARFLRKNHEMGEVFDQATLQSLIYGTGYVKVVWDKDLGDVADFNEETQELDLDGDHCIYSPDTLAVWLDPDAKRKKDVRWTIEACDMQLEEAVFKWPQYEKELRENVQQRQNRSASDVFQPTAVVDGHNMITILEYRERGMPINGMKGRKAMFLESGVVLETGHNDHYQHRLPIKILTYIDVINQVYGKSVAEYTGRLQDMLNRMDSSTLDSIQAHNLVRLIVPEGADIEDEAISDSTWDYIKASGNANDIRPLPAAQLMPDAWQLRAAFVEGIQEQYGVNDSMLGIQRREQSAVSQQSSVEQGTMVHRRLMAKYSRCTEEVYVDALGIARNKWKTPRQVAVLGEEKAFESADFTGADIAGGYDLDVEYGTSLPIDPNMAREQIMLMMPALKEAGVSPREILRRFKLNELEAVLDRMEMAADRQREIFEEMIAKADPESPEAAEYIAPRELEEHQGMLEYAYDFLMTSEFKYLPEETKLLLEQHIRERETMAAAGAQPPAAAPNLEPLPGSPGVSGAITPDVGGGPLPATGLDEEIV
jgi:hypothetical protein